MRMVIAIGGNALLERDADGSWEQQLDSARAIAAEVVQLYRAGHEVVLSHGNGPQVGALVIQHEEGEPQVPALPLDVLVAMTQGQLGYLLQTAIAAVDPDLRTVTVLTRVAVDPADPALASPTKPIGPFYSQSEAMRLATERGWSVGADSGRGWRAIVGSPRPLTILECEQIRALAGSALVIAGGGGGIPVDGAHGVRGVIDKDRCSAELALAIDAELLVLLTAVPRVAQDFGTRWERDLDRLTLPEAERLLASGEFPPGSMGPKIEAAGRFVRGGGRAAVVTAAGRLAEAVGGRDGTWIVPEPAAAEAAA
jgi:carbamate kinase